jgi:hypothetical protein
MDYRFYAGLLLTFGCRPEIVIYPTFEDLQQAEAMTLGQSVAGTLYLTLIIQRSAPDFSSDAGLLFICHHARHQILTAPGLSSLCRSNLRNLSFPT